MLAEASSLVAQNQEAEQRVAAARQAVAREQVFARRQAELNSDASAARSALVAELGRSEFIELDSAQLSDDNLQPSLSRSLQDLRQLYALVSEKTSQDIPGKEALFRNLEIQVQTLQDQAADSRPRA